MLMPFCLSPAFAIASEMPQRVNERKRFISNAFGDLKGLNPKGSVFHPRFRTIAAGFEGFLTVVAFHCDYPQRQAYLIFRASLFTQKVVGGLCGAVVLSLPTKFGKSAGRGSPALHKSPIHLALVFVVSRDRDDQNFAFADLNAGSDKHFWLQQPFG